MIRAVRVVLGVLVVGALAGLAACGNTATNNVLSVALAPVNSGSTTLPSGSTQQFEVSVYNNSASPVDGVSVQVVMPTGFRYASTISISGNGAKDRTQSNDAQVGVPNPTWGLWSLPGEVILADGTKVPGELDVTFSATALSPPGSFQLSAKAASGSTNGNYLSKPLAITVTPAPQLSMSITASPPQVKPGGTVNYSVTVSNLGSGNATGVTVLVTMPSSFAFVATGGIAGDSANSNGTRPITGSDLVDYGGFTVPARSSSGPGILLINFTASVNPDAAPGSFPTAGQVTDAAGDYIEVPDTVPILIIAPATPSPGPTPSGRPAATPTPGA